MSGVLDVFGRFWVELRAPQFGAVYLIGLGWVQDCMAELEPARLWYFLHEVLSSWSPRSRSA